MSGTGSLQAARTSSMTQTQALDALETVGKSRGDKRVRENSRTFSKGAKREALNTELNAYRQAICGDNKRLQQVWDNANTQNGLGNMTHDMTGNELQALVQAVRNELQGQPAVESNPIRRSVDFDGSATMPVRPSVAFSGPPATPMSMRPSVGIDGRQVQVEDGRTRSHTQVHGHDNIPGPPALKQDDEAYLQQAIREQDTSVDTPKVPEDKRDWNKIMSDAAKATDANNVDFEN